MEDSFLKKLCLLVSILPLFGCNNTVEAVSPHSDKPNYTQIYEQVPSPAMQKTENPATTNTTCCFLEQNLMFMNFLYIFEYELLYTFLW